MSGRIEIVFKISYLLLVLSSFNVFFARQSYITCFSLFVIGLGLVVITLRLKNLKNYINAGVFILTLFLFSYVLGSINSFSYGYIDNIKAVVWMAFQYYILFAFLKDGCYQRERNTLFIVFLFYSFLSAMISFCMLITKWEYLRIDGNYIIRGGLHNGRLYGLFTDPNYGSVIAVISIIISIYFLCLLRKRKLIQVLFLLFNIVFEFLYVCYADSRTGYLSTLFVIIAFFVFKASDLKKNGKKIFEAIMIIAFLIGLIYFVQFLTSKYALVNIGGRLVSQIINGTLLSDGRIGIWKNAIELFKQNPVFGISFRNIYEYAVVNIPTTYLGYESMHNFFFDILVSQGIIGVITLFVLIVWVIWALIKKYKTLTNYSEFAFMVAIIVAIVASMLTYSETFYMNTGGAFMFWYVLGYLVNYKEEETFEKSVNAELL